MVDISSTEKLFELSDEDFVGQMPPEVIDAGEEAKPVIEPEKIEEPVVVDPVEDKPKEPATEDKSDPELYTPESLLVPEENPKKEGEVLDSDPVTEGDPQPVLEEPIDYEAAFKEIMKPFKANGKMIELKDSKEVVQLLQMGANYTKKLQELQPARATLLLLQQQGLMNNPERLNLLLDVHNGSQEALKKLVKDSGMDLLDIDPNEELSYTPTNHSVDPKEVEFTTILQNLSSNPEGVQTLTAINTTWDQESKDALGFNPVLLEQIHEQRESGVYSLITDRMDHLKMLGQISADVPFLKAYYEVGQQMQAEENAKRNAAIPPLAKTAPVVEQPKEEIAIPPVAAQPLAKARAVAPKPQLDNNDKAIAAAQQRTTPKKASTLINPLAMSDDEFMKRFDSLSGRL